MARKKIERKPRVAKQVPIIDPVPVEDLMAELTEDKLFRHTNKAGNEIYIVNANNAPAVMRELGRLREISFRTAGGGTGKALDIDRYDTMDKPCEQLVLWNPDAKEIIGGYRFILGQDIHLREDGQPDIATSHLFHFSKRFIKEYLPYTIELGRSFVRPEYQSSKAGAKALFALDNLWDGLGALCVKYPQVKYFFGKVTMYPSFGEKGRDLILYFLKKHFGGSRLVKPLVPLRFKTSLTLMQRLFPTKAIKENYKELNKNVRELGQNIPPLVNAYMNLSETMKVFGTAINDEFGYVEETGILITIADIYPEKRDRHIQTYIEELKQKFGIGQLNIS